MKCRYGGRDRAGSKPVTSVGDDAAPGAGDACKVVGGGGRDFS